MTGGPSGLTARIKGIAPESKSTYYITNREMLASRKMIPEFNSALNKVV